MYTFGKNLFFIALRPKNFQLSFDLTKTYMLMSTHSNHHNGSSKMQQQSFKKTEKYIWKPNQAIRPQHFSHFY